VQSSTPSSIVYLHAHFGAGSMLGIGGRSLNVTFVLESASASVIVEIYVCN
jgi:hypothetical protein